MHSRSFFRFTSFLSLLLFLHIAATASNPHTRVKAFANVESIKPGSEFTVGILMVMDEGWHTYWKNPGEAGLPTTIQWTLPKGISAGEIEWPVPHKYIEGGEVLTYGYENENMLLIRMKAEASIEPGSNVRIKGSLDWLECERVCIPGSGSVTLALAVRSEEPRSSHTELFARFDEQIPKRFEPGQALSARHETKERQVLLTVTSNKDLVPDEFGAADFYPNVLEGIEFGRSTVSTTGAITTITLPLSSVEKIEDERTLRGILVYRIQGEKRRGEELEIPLSMEFCASLSEQSSSEGNGGVLDLDFNSIQATQGGEPLYVYFLFAVIGGLLLNIMPCVLPVIALKIFRLVSLGGDEPRKVRRLGWMFSFGILASFLSLAILVILLQAAGAQVGWGFQFQEPAFVVAMSTVVFAFGLSLFGVFEIRLPGFAVEGVSTAASRQSKGLTSSFAEGVFATILATPCTAPFLGTALGFAFSQPAYITLLLFGGVAFGMALPYLILTSKPAWTKYLPKPGEWMVKAKQFMGFLMMATLLWLLYVLGKQLGMEAVVWTGAFLLTVGVACWLIGSFATLVSSRTQHVLTWIGVLTLLFIGYNVFLTTVFDATEVLAASDESSVSSARDAIQWHDFSISDLEDKLSSNRPVFIDFTAEWCLTCKLNEKTVIADEDVVKKFRELDVIAIRADWTNRNNDITKLLAKFGRSGVPLYVIFPPGKPTEPIVLPEIITAGILTNALDLAVSSKSAEGPR